MIISIIIALVLAGFCLWALGLLPLDATVVKIARVVVIGILLVYLLGALTGRALLPL